MAMKREDRDTWVAALRSGEYRQGVGYLCDSDGAMCCLGVAYDVLHDGDWMQHPLDDGIWRTEAGLQSYWFPPGASGGIEESLVRMNDGGATFAEIADWIEANVEVSDD